MSIWKTVYICHYYMYYKGTWDLVSGNCSLKTSSYLKCSFMVLLLKALFFKSLKKNHTSLLVLFLSSVDNVLQSRITAFKIVQIYTVIADYWYCCVFIICIYYIAKMIATPLFMTSRYLTHRLAYVVCHQTVFAWSLL